MTFTDDFLSSLLDAPEAEGAALAAEAEAVTLARHGRGILLRGLVEATNRCRNRCLYCGIRAGNDAAVAHRYLLSADEIVAAARRVYSLGLRTVVIQGGEYPAADEDIARAVSAITTEMPAMAVTLSLGERPEGVYRRWREAGASRFLLRHEAADPTLYASLHPEPMTLTERIECLRVLRRLGYQVGVGMMIGVPGQRREHLMADLRFIRHFSPEMIGIGPFIPAPGTPLAHHPAGSISLTLRLISILRLMLPDANIPSTTALATLAPDGRERGILAGANVVMPNFTPADVRADYALYARKASSGAESGEGLQALACRLRAINRFPDFSRGDFRRRDIPYPSPDPEKTFV